jgi:hypothetical protein
MKASHHETFTSRELTEAALKVAAGVWVDTRNDSERAANLDSNLLRRKKLAMERIDYLLENLLLEMSADDGTLRTA